MIQHRGLPFEAPNTLQCLREHRAVEIDVFLTREGELLVLHDKDHESLDGQEVAEALTLEQARALKISPLYQWVIIAQELKAFLLIELKASSPEQAVMLALRVFELIREYELTPKQVAVQSFSYEALLALHGESMRNGYQLNYGLLYPSAPARVQEMKISATLVTHLQQAGVRHVLDLDDSAWLFGGHALARELRCGFMSVHHSCVTRTLIQRCGQDRMQVAAWVVNTPELRDHLLAQEVVAIGEI